MLKMAWSAAEVQAIKTNSYSKVYLPGQPHSTCKYLEDLIGKDAFNRPVLTAAEIRTGEEAIIVVGSQKPMKERMIPYYEHWLLSSRASYPPFQQIKKIPFDTPPLLQL
jgi:type IV secretory pathway TraG/TraD family ATPase VirD4